MSALEDFATWEPLLRLMREELKGPDGRASGFVGSGSWSVPVAHPRPAPGRALLVSDMQAEWDAVERVRDALDGRESVPFVADFAADGRVALRLVGLGDSAEDGIGGAAPGGIVLVEGAVAAPWRRVPGANPDAVPAPGADAELLERTLRERLPDAVGASDEEIAAAEERLGITLPEELKAVYRVTRARWADWADDYEKAERVANTLRCELFPLDQLYIADVASRPSPWEHAATEAISTGPDSAVQGLVGSPGWIAFGGNGGGDDFVIDLTPGPRGHLGQIIQLSHEESCGAALIADSLTDMIVHRNGPGAAADWDDARRVAHVNHASLRSVEEAANPELEVLCLGVWEDEPFSLAPVFDCPRLRTLTAYPHTLADPLEIQRLEHLEYLELVPEDWRVLLDANAVPRTLLAAKIGGYGNDPLDAVSLANELLALFGRPLIGQTLIEGVL